MGVKVSVVVPVCNPGDGDDAFDACVRALLEQTLPSDEYEVIFADDGSTDGTRARLDAVAAARPNVRVLHLEHRGSPLRGRNAGLSVARGDYVYLLGQRDRLERDALEHMHRMAVDADADVLVGRLVYADRPPPTVFERNRERADLLDDDLLGLLTPHKLFRRTFVESQWLSFPDLEGELSEHAFVVRAYLAAKVVAVLADRICCHLGPEPERPIDPAAYADGLRVILDTIDDFTEPGERRDRLYAHWLRACVLRRLGGRRLLAMPPEERGPLFAELRELVRERFPSRIDEHLPVRMRARAALTRTRGLADLVALAEAARGTRLRAELRGMRWEGGELLLDVAGEIVRGDGSPVCYRRMGGRLLWTPPAAVPDQVLSPRLAEVPVHAPGAGLTVYVRHAETGAVYTIPATGEITQTRDGDLVRLQATGTARLDVGTAALGRSLQAGLWEVHLHMNTGAHTARARARARGRRSPLNCVGGLADDGRRLVVPFWSERGELGVCVEPRSFADSIALVSAGASIARRDGHVFVVLPVPYVPPSGGPAIEFVLVGTDARARQVSAPALVEPGMPGRLAGQLVAKLPVRRLPAAGALSPGSWVPYLRVDEREVELRFGLHVRWSGRLRLILPGEPDDAAASPLRRLAARLPGGRLAVRFGRALRERYAPQN
jgi:glycosyltransferase involved in cell wall biosynthesis